jgi:hypothetical protein
MDQAELDRRFTRHTVDEDQAERGNAIRQVGLQLADLIAVTTPESREQSLAITALEEAVFWANAAIARREA